MRRMSAAAILAGGAAAGSAPARRLRSKEQQQLMAEIRMLQENQQQLAADLIALADTLKAVTGRIDDQAAASRKAFADQQLLIEGMTDTVRMLREKSDDTNVRLSSMTQELESLRQTIASMPQPVGRGDAGHRCGRGPGRRHADSRIRSGAADAGDPPPNVSPQRMYDTAYADYTAGQYDLAVEGSGPILNLPASPSTPTMRS